MTNYWNDYLFQYITSISEINTHKAHSQWVLKDLKELLIDQFWHKLTIGLINNDSITDDESKGLKKFLRL